MVCWAFVIAIASTVVFFFVLRNKDSPKLVVPILGNCNSYSHHRKIDNLQRNRVRNSATNRRCVWTLTVLDMSIFVIRLIGRVNAFVTTTRGLCPFENVLTIGHLIIPSERFFGNPSFDWKERNGEDERILVLCM